MSANTTQSPRLWPLVVVGAAALVAAWALQQVSVSEPAPVRPDAAATPTLAHVPATPAATPSPDPRADSPPAAPPSPSPPAAASPPRRVEETPVPPISAPAPAPGAPPPSAAPEPAADARPDGCAALDDLARRYGIAIVYRETQRATALSRRRLARSADPSAQDLAESAPVLVAELERYPVAVLGKTGLRKIVLCRDLSVDLHPWDGIAIPDDHALYVDVADSGARAARTRRVIHHELFHLIDQADDGTAEDPVWQALNPASFQYKRGPSGVSDDPTVLLARSVPAGFVSKYATVAVDEDKAEVFATLMTEPDALAARMAGDAVLAAKVRQMDGLLSRFAEDARFWTIPAVPAPRVAETPPAGPGALPPDWPPCQRPLPTGSYLVRIRNPNAAAVKVGLRTGSGGLDLDVPGGATREVEVPAGTYEMFFCYQNQPAEVYQGDNVTLQGGMAGVEIQLVAAAAGNYGLRRFRRP